MLSCWLVFKNYQNLEHFAFSISVLDTRPVPEDIYKQDERIQAAQTENERATCPNVEQPYSKRVLLMDDVNLEKSYTNRWDRLLLFSTFLFMNWMNIWASHSLNLWLKIYQPKSKYTICNHDDSNKVMQ